MSYNQIIFVANNKISSTEINKKNKAVQLQKKS